MRQVVTEHASVHYMQNVSWCNPVTVDICDQTAFLAAANSRIWNSVSRHVTSAPAFAFFRNRLKTYFFDHPQSGVVYNFGCVCLSVRIYVCLSDDNFRKSYGMKFMSVGYIRCGVKVRIWRSPGQCQGHRNKQKCRKCVFPQYVKLRSLITPLLWMIEAWGLHAAWGLWLWPIEWCDCHLCHITGSDHA